MFGLGTSRADTLTRPGGSSRLSASVIDRLPEAARRKLDNLRAQEAEARDALGRLSDQHMQLTANWRDAKQRRDATREAHERGNRSSGRPVSSSRSDFVTGGSLYYSRPPGSEIQHIEPALSTAAVDAAEAEVKRLEAERDAVAGRIRLWQSRRSDIVKQIDTYLAKLPHNVEITEVSKKELPKPLTYNGGGPVAAVEQIRGRITGLLNDVVAVQSAPIHSSIAKDRMRQQVAAMAKAPDTLPLIELGSQLRWPTVYPTQSIGNIPATPAPDILGLFCWAFEGHIVELLEDQIDSLADDKHALDDNERASAIAEIKAEILALERQEEMLIENSEDIARRNDADPRAVLGLSGLLPEPSF